MKPGIRYRMWLDGEGRPSVVECVGDEPATSELEQIRATIRTTRAREGVLIVGPEWEVRVAPQGTEILRRIETRLDRAAAWSGLTTADGRPISAVEKVEMDRLERERLESEAIA